MPRDRDYDSFMSHKLLRDKKSSLQSFEDNLGSITEPTEIHKITSKSLTILKVRFYRDINTSVVSEFSEKLLKSPDDFFRITMKVSSVAIWTDI